MQNKIGKIISIDGKAVKSATDKINNGNIPYIVSAYLGDIGLSIGQIKVDDKTNEITVIDLLEIEGAIITIDAIGIQEKIVSKIVEKVPLQRKLTRYMLDDKKTLKIIPPSI